MPLKKDNLMEQFHFATQSNLFSAPFSALFSALARANITRVLKPFPRQGRAVLLAILLATVALFSPGAFFLNSVTQIGLAADLGAKPLSVAAQDGILAVAGAEGTDLFRTPNGTVLRTLSPGSVMDAVGRTSDSQWVVVVTQDNLTAWAQRAQLVLFGMDRLPVVQPDDEAEEATPAPAEEASTPPAEEEATSAPEATPTAIEIPTSTPTEEPEPTATATTPPSPTPTPPPTATDTPEPTATPSPTATNTPRPTNTPVPTRTPTLAPRGPADVIVVVGGSGTELLDAPNGSEVQELRIGLTLNAVARSDDGQWLLVETGDATGWVAIDDVIAFRIDTLPFVSAAEESTTGAGEAEAAPTTMSEEGESEGAETGDTGGTVPPVAQEIDPSATATSLPETGVAATVATSGLRLNVRSGPGTNYEIVSKALNGQSYPVLAQSEAGDWLQIAVDDVPEGFGWVSVDFVEVEGAVEELPVSTETSSPPGPTATPTSAATTATPAEAAPTGTPSPEPESNETQAAAPAAQPVSRAVPAAGVTGTRLAGSGLAGTLVFQGTGNAIYAYSMSSGQLWQVGTGIDPAISPDGTRVAFIRTGGANGIYVINIDGTGEYKVAVGGELVRSPKWSPDGNALLFSRLTGEFTCFDPGIGLCFPSPFGNVDKDERGLSLVDLGGDNFRDVPALNTARAPDWIDAGIVYHAATGIEKTQDKPGHTTESVINYQIGYQDPDWQPGGGRIVYQVRQGSHWELYSINPDGSSETSLTRPVTTLVRQLPSNVAPVWSPDGQHIAFLSNRQEDHEAGPWRLWVMNGDGSNQRPLPIDVPIDYGFNWEQIISWGL